MFTKNHSWEKFQHPQREKTLVACSGCGLVRFNNNSQQGMCTEKGLEEALITRYGYSPRQARIAQPA